MNAPSSFRDCSVAITLFYVAQQCCAWSLLQGAAVHPDYKGKVPEKSAVVFSTRFERENAFDAINAFGVTRVEWVYAENSTYISRVKKLAPWFGGAMNANGPLPSDDGMARDFDGNVLTPPWMKGWGAKWITTTHPETQKAISDQFARYLTAGANSIQFDDALLQYHGALHYGGDFNDSTLSGFSAYVDKYPDKGLIDELGLKEFKGDYRGYLKARHNVKNADDYKRRFRSFPSSIVWLSYIRSTVDGHYSRLKDQAKVAGSGSIPFSMNMFDFVEPTSSNPYLHFSQYADYSMPETDITQFSDVVSMAATARSIGLGWVPSIRPLTLDENRAAVASMYAMGGQPLVPWDIYSGNDETGKAKRFFGSAKEYGDLYAFVRANKALFNEQEETAIVGIIVPVDKYETQKTRKLVRDLVAAQVPFAFIPVGGSDPAMKADTRRLQNFKVIIKTNPNADYPPSALKSLGDSKVQQLEIAALRGEKFDEWKPLLIAPGANSVRLFPRAASSEPGRLVVHVVDTASKAASAETQRQCNRRLGIRSAFLADRKIVSAEWITPGNRKGLTVEESQSGVFVSINDCPLWGIVSFELGQAP